MKEERKLINGHYDSEWRKHFISPIPPHLTPEERQVWEKEIQWEEQERERRKNEGFYKY